MTFGMGGGNHHHHQHSSSSSPDDYVFGTDEVTNGLLCWDTRTGVLVKRMDRGVAQAGLRCIAVSPVEDVVITAG